MRPGRLDAGGTRAPGKVRQEQRWGFEKEMTSLSVRLCSPILMTRCGENSMLKISFNKTPTEERWILHGRLAGPWVHELGTCWKVNHRTDEGRACIVDLDEVRFIDKSGERLLCIMARDGARFTASGICTKHFSEHLNVRRKRFISNPVAVLIVLASVVTLGGGCEHRVGSAPAPAP